MTREENFRASFISQFGPYSGWQHTERIDMKKIPLSSIPSYSIDLGKTKYTAVDLAGKAIAGEQEFTTTVYYTLPLRGTVGAYLNHSDIMNMIEQFMNNPLYIPPPVFPGDPCRIDRTMLLGARAPVIQFGETRYAVSIACKYVFTIF